MTFTTAAVGYAAGSVEMTREEALMRFLHAHLDLEELEVISAKETTAARISARWHIVQDARMQVAQRWRQQEPVQAEGR